ncbi:glutaminyl-peptide cyclotransferase [Drosophila subpulchrella]|uniref:glutaminyl-peptide cyclotransferase n=1 Tax=Drosophila subpulchrella TaxID=1486046 RepID=UPI0018A160A4|nr:glutaminyl-peptide cyclotransferase [Drosophila subpulchrella]
MASSRCFIFLIPIAIIIFIFAICQSIHRNVRVIGRNKTLRYEPTALHFEQMRYLAGLSDPEDFRKTVQRISVKRVVDTPGHSAVRKFIIEYLKKLNWKVELDSFTEKVPLLGSLTFHNIMARQNPTAKRYLMLGCHYDSKYFKEFDFVAATDSAVPCALMLNLAKVLKDQLHRSEISLMLVFFDGEEAFEDWSDKDSLYGSRHLAELWEKRGFLNSIDLFMLLDLIGAKDVVFKNNIQNTSTWFQRFVQLEKKLIKTGILRTEGPIFKFESSNDNEDDHLPFVRRHVPVIHLISSKYPAVWHLAEDVEQNVDYNTTEQVGLVLRMFVMEYLNSAASQSFGLTKAIH